MDTVLQQRTAASVSGLCGTQCTPGISVIRCAETRRLLQVTGNHLYRQFAPAEPDQAWVSDITYIPTATGWSYLAVILDLYSRKVVGWSIVRQMPASLACDVLRMALAQRQPPPGLPLHSDQGCQYTSDAWQRLLADHRIRVSMSRRGNCWDNAVVERFFLNLKMERVWQRRYANHGEVRRDIADYIVAFCNAVRTHSALGYLPPDVYEQQTADNPPIAVSEIT